MFGYFYTTIQYNPVEMANNLKQNNGTIPGIRPGAPTADFIRKILSRITLIGCLFLGFIALFPLVYSALTNMGSMSMGGTSIIIMVGVALETSKQMESQMMMRHYKGFLD
jgi:preprotein translocase subunit SecY